jgi:hypothetical protein
MKVPAWKAISTTVEGRNIQGEYAVVGHLTKVRHGEREKGADRTSADPEIQAREMLRELAAEGKA